MEDTKLKEEPESREEYNKRLHRQFLEGDMEALNWLFYENEGLVGYFYNRYKFVADKRNDLDYEDIDQCCKLGLTIGITNWKPEKGSLARVVGWYIKREVRNLTWKRQKSREKAQQEGHSTDEVSLSISAGEDEEATLEEITQCPKGYKNPHSEGLGNCVTEEFFDHLENKSKPPPPADQLQELKDYVYNGNSPESFKRFQRIRDIIKDNASTKERAFWDKWLEENRLNFYPSLKYKEIKTKTNENADPTAEDAIKLMFERETLANEIEDIIENI